VDGLSSVLLATPALLESPPTFFDRAGDLPLILLLVLSSAGRIVWRRDEDKKTKGAVST
jgi:hypothetical protein